MAVLPSLPGIEVTVQIGGIALTEYNDEEPDVSEGEVGRYQAARTVSNYIESRTDQEFAIHLSAKIPYKMNCALLSFKVCVDGRVVCSPLLFKRSYEQRWGGWDRYIKGIKSEDNNGSPIIRQFKFTGIETTTGEDGQHDTKKDSQVLKEIGELKILVYRNSDATRTEKSVNCSLANDCNTTFHEKSMKGQAKSHLITLGDVSKIARRTLYDAKKIDGVDRPIAIYKFKYCSLEALKSLLVIERTPTPEPPPVGVATSILGHRPLSLQEPASATIAMLSPQDPQAKFSLDHLTPAKKRQLEQFLSGLMAEYGQADASEATSSPSDTSRSSTRTSGIAIKTENQSDLGLPTRSIGIEDQAGADGLQRQSGLHSKAKERLIKQENQIPQAGPRAPSALLVESQSSFEPGANRTGGTFGTLNSPAVLKREREESDRLGSRKQAKLSPCTIIDLTLDD